MSYGDSCSHPSGYEQGNTGYSGTPLWKIRQQMEAQRSIASEIPKEKPSLLSASSKSPRCFTGFVALSDNPKKVQLDVRHVLVKDLRKVAQVLRIPLPSKGIFEDDAGLLQCSLSALFDGQVGTDSGTGSSQKTAEFYCKNLPAKLLSNLTIIPAERCNHVFMQSALLKTFEDLESQAVSVLGSLERCAAAVALVVGDWVFTAVLGRCGALVGKPIDENTKALRYSAFEFGGRKRGPTGGSLETSVPEVSGNQVDWSSNRGPPCVVLTSSALAESLSTGEIMGSATMYKGRPRAASGDIVSKALGRLRNQDSGDTNAPSADGAAIVTYFNSVSPASTATQTDPVAKKPRIDGQALQSMRIRHILARHKDCKNPVDPVKNRPVTRSRSEAEAVLRNSLAELMKDGDHSGESMWAAKATQRITNICRTTSECKSALKGGSMCGDLGWVGKKELQALGKDTEDAIRALQIAEWSDILHSDQGAHLVMRIA